MSEQLIINDAIAESSTLPKSFSWMVQNNSDIETIIIDLIFMIITGSLHTYPWMYYESMIVTLTFKTSSVTAIPSNRL